MDIDDSRNDSRDFRCGCVDIYRDSNLVASMDYGSKLK